MIIVMKRNAPRSEIDKVTNEIEKNGLNPIPLYGTERTVIAVIGDERKISIKHIKSFKWVSTVMPVLKPYKLASRETKHENTLITLKNGVTIGGKEIVIMAGPCSVESEAQIHESADALSKAGVKVLRGGAYKPRTGPYSFEGHGEDALKWMREAADKNNMAVVTELMDQELLDLVNEYSDIIQVGARNMQNYVLLKALGKTQTPILLKRGMSATIKEWLLAAEYILAGGNPNVILCERGIRTFEKETRNTMPINSVPVIKELSHLPIIVDPSHAAGKRSLVPALTKAGIAAGADGAIIEAHPNPEEALSDGDQSMFLDEFQVMMNELKPLAAAIGRELVL